jgi:arylsulfatase A-like enzyme
MLRKLTVRLCLAAALLPFLPGPVARPSGEERRPNVLVFLMDDQRADSMLVMPKTRRWFEEGGTHFAEAYASTPLCCPLRSSLMSGRYQHNHGVLNNQSGELLDQDATLQKYLRDAGYQTGLDGKFLVSWPIDKVPPHFDRSAHFLGGYTDVKWNVDGKRQTPDQYVTDFQSDRAVEFLDHFAKQPGRPWYLYITPQAPHLDFTPAPRHAEAPVPEWEPSPAVTEKDRSDKPEFIRKHKFTVEEGREARTGQLRTLLAVDEMVDRIFRRLQETGELEDTLAIYTSDSGWQYGEHGLRSKATPYTASVAVPFYVRWPGRLAAGASDPRPVAPVDVAPTVLEAAGLSPKLAYPFDGRSLLKPEGRKESLLEHHHSPDFSSVPSWASIRNQEFQYVEWYADEAGTKIKVREYYDLTADPWQLENILGDKDPANDPAPATLDDVSSRLARYRRCAGTSGSKACP